MTIGRGGYDYGCIRNQLAPDIAWTVGDEFKGDLEMILFQ